MQFQSHGRVHSHCSAERLVTDVAQLAGGRGGCLVATAMLTERQAPIACVVPTGVFGADIRHLDDMDRAVLVAQLWIVINRMERDLGQESGLGATAFRDLVDSVRGSLMAGPTFAPIGTLADAAVDSEHPEYTLLGSIVSTVPLAGEVEITGSEGDR